MAARSGFTADAAGRDDDVRGRLDPLALVIDAGEVVDGADDGVGGGCDVVHAFNEATECEAQSAVAPSVEPNGADVTIERGTAEIVVADYIVRRAPFYEIGFDFLAIAMRADFAVAFVMRAVERSLGRIGFGSTPLTARLRRFAGLGFRVR